MKKFTDKSAKVAVIGLGYVGLPLAIEIANKGFEVFGIDLNKDKIDCLNSGKSYILDVNDELINRHIGKNLFVGHDYSIISEVDSVIICVPTPLNEMKEPDLSYVKLAMENVIEYLDEGTLIVLESTTYPGTTEDLIVKVIEENLGFKVGNNFFVCNSPERVDPSNSMFFISNTPKVIGGSTLNCLEVGSVFYNTFIEKVVPVSSTKVAEMSKLIENTFRSVNVALINELTIMSECMGISIWEVIEAASSKPFGYMPFYPGIGVGGHCLPIDPIYLSWKARTFDYNSRFIELTREINESMPQYAVNQIANILNSIEKSIKNSSILIIGLTYKKDTNDLRESPSLKLLHLLKEKGAKVVYHDPYVPSLEYNNEILYSHKLDKHDLSMFDIVVITVNHSNLDYQFIVNNSKIVYDTKNATQKCKGENIILIGDYIKLN
jgi:UDP-N-acetyl-D-glucosamine dehydrogenase